MKTTLFSLMMLMYFGSSVFAQEQKKPNSGLGIGFQVNQFQDDFAFGLNMTSPEILNGNAAFRLKANQVYFEHLLDGEYVWSGYQNVSLGFWDMEEKLAKTSACMVKEAWLAYFLQTDFPQNPSG